MAKGGNNGNNNSGSSRSLCNILSASAPMLSNDDDKAELMITKLGKKAENEPGIVCHFPLHFSSNSK